ncbi:MAG TPA: diacylglycerol kinase family protein [Candidatus Limnocylindrales bacterium]|nr:diacylglycerol kinase family protein [Candidatus Limnocylindrales bacterium]
MKYSAVYIIYNPNSTGSSREVAEELKGKLVKKYPKLEVSLEATKYAGHAEKIAYKCAKKTKRPLIISSSGDGGYNEVINGAIRAQLKGAKPVCAVLPAGNANDHSRTLQEGSLFKAITKSKESSLDLLRVSFKKNGHSLVRYAHSYVGLGLTPVVAVELNKTDLTALKELWIVLKTFYRFRPFKIKVEDKVFTLDSILFTNIGEMAKVLTVAKNAKPNDGQFEIVTFPHARKLRLIRRLAKATATGLEPRRQAKEYTFQSLKKMPIQFDGEVGFIDRGSTVKVEAVHKILTTIL